MHNPMCCDLTWERGSLREWQRNGTWSGTLEGGFKGQNKNNNSEGNSLLQSGTKYKLGLRVSNDETLITASMTTCDVTMTSPISDRDGDVSNDVNAVALGRQPN